MYGVFVDVAGDGTIVSDAVRHEPFHAGPVRMVPAGTVLHLTGLEPDRAHTITLTDTRGRVAVAEETAGAGGSIAASTANLPCGVYMVTVRYDRHVHSATIVVP